MALATSPAVADALRAVVRHPWRSLLICQGMLWAVALAVVPAAILEGSRTAAVARAAELGTDRIEITAAADARPAECPDASDLDALRAVLPPNALIAALEAEPARLAPAGDPVWLLEAHGDIPRARNLPLVAGEWPREMAAAPAARGDAGDLTAGATPVPVVIESGLARRLAAGGDALGLELAFAAAANGKPAQIRVPTPAETIAAPERTLRVDGVLVDESKQSTNAFGIEKKHLFTEQVHALL
ncbi:MAG: hypothetical protein L0Z55_00405, partial [Planctomycetes bacterium]|nr:hypothetical protein [Planctomycetota bacterium]